MSRTIYAAVMEAKVKNEMSKIDVVDKAEGMDEQDKKKKKPEQPEAHAGSSDGHLKTEKQEEEESTRI